MIREATPDDIEALKPLARAYTDFYESDPSDEGLAALLEMATDRAGQQYFVLVAEADEGHIVGFAISCWKWSSLKGARVLFLDDLFVDPEERGKGHADELIEALADRARANGAPVVAWLTMPDNKRAHAVYDRAGGKATELIEYELEV